MKQPISIPAHIAVIMDGNRRWAREHRLPVYAGHSRVVNRVLEPLIEHASDIGIKYLTFWAFSTENWRRDKREVDVIMRLLRVSLKKFGEKMHRKGCRIRAIGDLGKFSPDIQGTIKYLEDLTQNNSTITTVFALNYGGRDEIIRAIHKMSFDQSSNLTIQQFNNLLDTSGIPDPDLIVRTGGEQRLSGFLLWQCQYSELFFPDFYMPDFTPEKLDKVIDEFNSRQRRFGR